MMELSYTPLTPWIPGKLPGMAPLAMCQWLNRDEAFAPQMAWRDELIAGRAEIVLAGERTEGAEELLDLVLCSLIAHDREYEVGADEVRRPDGVTVPIDRSRPLATLGRLVQEDFVILRKEEEDEEHVLAGAVLCFPSRWSLAEKFERPLVAIHDRVPVYDDGLAPRVQRLFDVLTPDRPLVRANWLLHPTPELHQPKLFDGNKKPHVDTGRYWLRVERQAILKLRETGRAVFSIKTFVTPVEALSQDQRASLIEALEAKPKAMQDYHGGAEFTVKALTALRALRAL